MACHQMAKKSMFSQNRNSNTLYIIKISMNLIEFTYFSILQLRVPKESMPGLPYLRNSSIDNFIINIILLLLILEYGNLSQKSRKRDSETFYVGATCACMPAPPTRVVKSISGRAASGFGPRTQAIYYIKTSAADS